MRFHRQTLMLHPANRKYLEEVSFPDATPLVARDFLMGMPYTLSEAVPERQTHEEWTPPEGSRFTEYGPEDEAWMKPLGLGTTRVVDDGPAFFLVNEPNWGLWGGSLFQRPPLSPILASTC